MIAVSTVIPTYNAARFVGLAVDSALAQESVRNEVIVVDDGSTDNTADVLRAYGDRIRVITQRNSGVSAARNAGAAASRHATLAFLDADDAWLPGKLDTQCRALQAGYDAAGCGVFLTDANLRVTDVTKAPTCNLLELVHKKSNAGVNASTVVLRRSLFERIGGFCERLSTSADWDFAVRVLETGRVTSVHEPLVYYRQHGAAMHLNVALMERDMKLAFERLRQRRPAGVTDRDIEQGYARFWRILAGSYWHQRSSFHAVRCGLRSLIAQPSATWTLTADAYRVLCRR